MTWIKKWGIALFSLIILSYLAFYVFTVAVLIKLPTEFIGFFTVLPFILTLMGIAYWAGTHDMAKGEYLNQKKSSESSIN